MPKTLTTLTSDTRITVNGITQSKTKNCECWSSLLFIGYLLYFMNWFKLERLFYYEKIK